MRQIIAAILMCMIVCPAQAQWYRRAVQALTSWKPGTRSLPLFSSKLDRKTLFAQQQFQRMQKSVVQLIINNHPHYGSLDDGLHSAFVIEENYRGTKYLWGVTAAHYLLIHPAIKVKGLDKTFPISIQASGAYRYTDIALFPIPQEAAPYVEPLSLAKDPVQPEDTLTSYGFYAEGFQQVPNRRVQQITPSRLVTSYQFTNPNRAGACGGPVLNAKNEVVGVHCGSAPLRNSSFAVPAQHIRDLWAAYHHEFDNRPLLFNGQELYRMAVNEAILSVSVFKRGTEIFSQTVYSTDAQIDLAHLERIPYTAQGDKLILLLEQVPSAREELHFHTRHFIVEYDLRTKTVRVHNQAK